MAKRGNFNLTSSYAWHVPGVSGLFIMLGWLLVGAVLGNVIAAVLALSLGIPVTSGAVMLISYVMIFLPAMIASRIIGSNNQIFCSGFALDSNHFGKNGWVLTALACAIAVIAMSFCLDITTKILPPVPDSLKSLFEQMTGEGDIFTVACTCIAAPLFEEWFCRGTILRGLLNYGRVEGNSRNYTPATAIIISAIVFAVIHLNPWQGLVAFGFGCLFGYVYYRTGSLKLTILMHCVNNSLATVISKIDAFENADSWVDVLSPKVYAACFVVCVAVIYAVAVYIGRIELEDPQGNCDKVEPVA